MLKTKGDLLMVKVKMIRCLIVCIIVCFCATGCNHIEQDLAANSSDENTLENVSDKNDENVSVDYESYIGKIWVVEEWTGGRYDNPSFFLTKIQNGYVEGWYSIDSIAKPDFYFYSFKTSKYLKKLEGTLNKNTIEVQFSDQSGNNGEFVLDLSSNERIKMNLVDNKKAKITEESNFKEEMEYRPLNLNNIEHFYKIEECSLSTEMDNWGRVSLISGEICTEDKIHPVVYLANEDENILYDFDAPFKIGTRITKTEIKDVNKDGLDDVIINTMFIEDKELEPIIWTFIQRNDGKFYDSSLEEN